MQGQDRLLRFAGERFFAAQVREFDQLLRDGGGALFKAQSAQIMPKCAEHAHHVHAVVLVKSLIFGGDERLPHMQRDRIQRHIDAVLTPVEAAGALAIGVVDDARLIELREFQMCIRDRTKAAQAGELDPVIGRAREIERIVQILSRRTKNNPCLLYTSRCV